MNSRALRVVCEIAGGVQRQRGPHGVAAEEPREACGVGFRRKCGNRLRVQFPDMDWSPKP